MQETEDQHYEEYFAPKSIKNVNELIFDRNKEKAYFLALNLDYKIHGIEKCYKDYKNTIHVENEDVIFYFEELSQKEDLQTMIPLDEDMQHIEGIGVVIDYIEKGVY